MNGFPSDTQPPQSVSLPTKDDQLPPTPLELHNSFTLPSPKLPMTTSDELDPGQSPTEPLASYSSTKPKKPNTLNDLIDTEKQYVELLTGVIRKVAAAWSRTNLPPPELDTMFRSIEGVYKANRGLYSKLKDIGSNPSSPKALGDLLMRWIEDLKTPYTAYCTKYCTGFDSWEPVQSNPKLANILATFSASSPPSSLSESLWTLDTLFLLPKNRLKYYKKLYGRLLKTAEPGRSDHRLLLGALETLDTLLATVESRGFIYPGQPVESTPNPILETKDEIVIDTRVQDTPPTLPPIRSSNELRPAPTVESDGGSPKGGATSGGERSSQETAFTSVSRGSTSTLSMPISTLERRLRTERTIDIFTMKPKAVTLHMNPSSLTFTREMRFSADVVMRFTPRTTGQEIIHHQAHVFLLSDLFLVCERMTPEEEIQHASLGADMWLCYPPLAGKVLRVSDVEGQDNAVQVAIMRKEFLILETSTIDARNSLAKHLKECIEFSGSLPPPSKNPPPPVPPINPLHVRHTDPVGFNDRSTPVSRISSPATNSEMNGAPVVRSPPPIQTPEGNLNDDMNRMRMDGPVANARPLPPEPMPGSSKTHNSQLSTSAHSFVNHPPPLGVGHVPAPTRSSSFHSTAHQPYGPGQYSRSQSPHIPTSSHNPYFPPAGVGFGPAAPMQPSPYNDLGPIPMQGNQPINGARPTGEPYGLPSGPFPPRPPSAPQFSYHNPSIRKTPSSRSLASQFVPSDQSLPAPPLPSVPDNFTHAMSRNHSYQALAAPQPKPLLPSANARAMSTAEFDAPSPPGSPVAEAPQLTGPVTAVVTAQMKCKVFLQQQHAQWKSLGSAKLRLYRQDPTNVKQLVVEADDKNKSILISTIILTDGVERVGKTGVAIELSDKGTRTGVIYMIQLRNEKSAVGLFDSLLAGSDRSR